MSAVALLSMLVVATVGQAGCCYVLPRTPLVVPRFVQERPQCGCTYEMGWYGWAWYGSIPC
jgi:hypothetical protein